MARISLTDNGTMDTVLVCECGEEFCYSTPELGPDENEDSWDREAWIEEIIAECEDEHECQPEEE